MATREPATYIAATEIAILVLILYGGPGTAIRVILGMPLLAHLGYAALTGLPMRSIPGRPTGTSRQRRNQDLRFRVKAFLHEVRRVEDYVQRAKLDGRPRHEVEMALREAQKKMVAAAADVVEATGRSSDEPDVPSTMVRPMRVFAPGGGTSGTIGH